jgi:hypothetical protein
MTEQEIAEWLGLPPGTPIKPVIAEHLAKLGVPVSDADQVAVFGAFLECAGKAARPDGREPAHD